MLMMDIPRKRASIPPTYNIEKNLYFWIENHLEFNSTWLVPVTIRVSKLPNVLLQQVEGHVEESFEFFDIPMSLEIVL